ncbi:hypothetical protein GALMADRAFT_253490 [Galerina marginata CBS 339.88]|uniref:DUF6535 domain-containing protein n=1 Tax=Galerina marginata (strain CBS 339.88) TaxID=685588 RepID=A0A067SVL1_GALM3|nr:hypothetical protein GALMADRAFT_253490 [Galerina marginata CBS 339.88]
MTESEQSSQKAPPKKTPKVWNFEDDFEYTPPKPDGDPWNVLLKPLLEKDKVRCDGWKEEVQNLLIFAGLFSAVVTAFVVESYLPCRPTLRAAFTRPILKAEIGNYSGFQ